MGRIVCLMGKSAAGKDTVFKRMLKWEEPKLRTVVPYTTRPLRDGEKDGEEYFFTDEAGFLRLKEQGKIIEDRVYNTVHGPWRYFTADDDQWQDEGSNYVLIGTLEAYGKLQDYFGRDRLLPVMIELDDGIRLQRALDRERGRECPGYEEMCRRFLADSEDFAEDKIRAAGIVRRFENDDMEKCLKEIRLYIMQNL